MSEQWEEISIDEIKAPSRYSLAMGPFGSNIKTDNFVPEGVPVIRGGNLSGERFKDFDFVYLTEEKADELKSANAFPGDIVFTHRGTLGQVGIIPHNARYPRYVVSQSQMKLSCDSSKVDPLFVFYFFRSNQGQQYLLSNTSTTGVPAIGSPLTTLRNIRIPYPPLPIQHRIAHILGSLDDKIELNRQMNETLEAMARAIFKSWFVDFDPVRAKAKSRQPAGMDAETAALFPDGFEEVDGREVPRGWKLDTLGNVMVLTYGEALKKENRQQGPIPVYGSNGQIGWHDKKLSGGPGIIIGRKGNPGIVTWSETDFFAIDTTFYIIPKKSNLSLFYLYHELQRQDLQSLSADSAVPGLNRTLVYLSKILIPPSDIQEKFDLLLGVLNKYKYNNEDQSRTLAQIRDVFLPKLMGGEISV